MLFPTGVQHGRQFGQAAAFGDGDPAQLDQLLRTVLLTEDVRQSRVDFRSGLQHQQLFVPPLGGLESPGLAVEFGHGEQQGGVRRVALQKFFQAQPQLLLDLGFVGLFRGEQFGQQGVGLGAGGGTLGGEVAFQMLQSLVGLAPFGGDPGELQVEQSRLVLAQRRLVRAPIQGFRVVVTPGLEETFGHQAVRAVGLSQQGLLDGFVLRQAFRVLDGVPHAGEVFGTLGIVARQEAEPAYFEVDEQGRQIFILGLRLGRLLAAGLQGLLEQHQRRLPLLPPRQLHGQLPQQGHAHLRPLGGNQGVAGGFLRAAQLVGQEDDAGQDRDGLGIVAPGPLETPQGLGVVAALQQQTAVGVQRGGDHPGLVLLAARALGSQADNRLLELVRQRRRRGDLRRRRHKAKQGQQRRH